MRCCSLVGSLDFSFWGHVSMFPTQQRAKLLAQDNHVSSLQECDMFAMCV